MKKLILLFLMVFTLSCCEMVYDPEVFYVDEHFILIDRTKKEMVVEGNTTDVRTWKIQRVNIEGDSIMVGEITDDGCGCGIITDELWKTRNIGDTLYFEFINKERFALSSLVETSKPVETPEVNNSSTPKPFNNSLEKDRRILEIERQIISLELELSKLKEL